MKRPNAAPYVVAKAPQRAPPEWPFAIHPSKCAGVGNAVTARSRLAAPVPMRCSASGGLDGVRQSNVRLLCNDQSRTVDVPNAAEVFEQCVLAHARDE